MRAGFGDGMPVVERKTMTDPILDRIDESLIRLIVCQIKWFLLEQRRVRKNDDWFTVERIAAELDLRRDLIPSLHALKQLSASPSIEARDGLIRHA